MRFGQYIDERRRTVCNRNSACEFSSLGDTEILQAMNEELLQIVCLGSNSAIVPERQPCRKSASDGRVRLGGADIEFDGEIVV